jgi:flagellar protein FliO/FliZ
MVDSGTSRHLRPNGEGGRGGFSFLRRAALCALLLGALGSQLFAQQVTTTPTGEQTPLGQGAAATDGAATARVPLVSTWDFVRMLIVLAAVIAVIYLIFVLLRRSTRRSTVENDLISVLGSKSLAANRTLHLVRVGKSVYLVGAAEGGVGLVSEISDQESIDQLMLRAEKQRTSAKKSFSEILGGIVPQGGVGQLSLPDGLGFMKKQKDRLRKLRSV